MKLIENVTKEEYENFVKNHKKSHFLQSYAWGEFAKKEKENPFSQDGVHPKGFYYSLWAKNMAEYLKNH